MASVDTPEEQKALLRDAVQDRYFALVSEGDSPTAAAAHAIRDVAGKATLLPQELSPVPEVDTAQRSLKFELEASTAPCASHSSTAPAREVGPVHEVNTAQRSLEFELEGSTAPGASHSSTAPKGFSHSSTAPGLSAQRSSSAADLLEARGFHRNRDTWKTFGIHLPAGRILKSLYGAKVEMPPVQRFSPPTGPPTGLDTYISVNNLKVGSIGLQYRKSMNLFDFCGGAQEFVRWGDCVEGYRIDAGWLQVGDRFLPTTVNNTQLLKRWDGPDAVRAPGIKRQQSLPALRVRPKERPKPELSVGGIPCYRRALDPLAQDITGGRCR